MNNPEQQVRKLLTEHGWIVVRVFIPKRSGKTEAIVRKACGRHHPKMVVSEILKMPAPKYCDSIALAEFKKHAEELHQQQINPKKPTWILGIVDSYGAVHSHKVGPGAIHTDFWPVCPPKAWRYLIRDKRLQELSCAPSNRADLNVEELDAVRRHLEKQGYELP